MNPPPSTQTTAALPAVPHLLVAAQAAMWAHAQQLAPGWLTDSEQVRLTTMRNPQRRQEFVACRYALRSLLAAATETTVEHWRLDAPEGAAPRLNAQYHGAHTVASTHLTLSHSGSYVVCGVAAQPVGVDIEVEKFRPSKRDALALAALACSTNEVQQLRALDCGLSRERMLVQWWSLKEAYFKCIGTGIDFSSIQRIECRRAIHDAVLPPSLAQGRLWTGKTALGCDVVLSLCSLERIARSCVCLGDDSIEWQGQSDWVVVEA